MTIFPLLMLVPFNSPSEQMAEDEEGKGSLSKIGPMELEQLYDEIDAEIQKSGLPSEEELRAEVEELNRTAAVKVCPEET